MFALLKLPPPPPKVQVPARVRMLEKHGIDITLCPKCKSGSMELLATYYRGVLCKTYKPDATARQVIAPGRWHRRKRKNCCGNEEDELIDIQKNACKRWVRGIIQQNQKRAASSGDTLPAYCGPQKGPATLAPICRPLLVAVCAEHQVARCPR
jgi:hypothetical protein